MLGGMVKKIHRFELESESLRAELWSGSHLLPPLNPLHPRVVHSEGPECHPCVSLPGMRAVPWGRRWRRPPHRHSSPGQTHSPGSAGRENLCGIFLEVTEDAHHADTHIQHTKPTRGETLCPPRPQSRPQLRIPLAAPGGEECRRGS